MTELVVLGSGSPLPDRGRAGSAVAVVGDEEDDGWVLVDCGRGATQRAIDAGLDLTRVVAVALTHHHSDHVNDLATFATTRWTAGGDGPLIVVAPEGPAADLAVRCLDPFGDDSFLAQAAPGAPVRPHIHVQTFGPTAELSEVLTFSAWTVSAVLVDHHPIEPAVGYLVEHGDVRVAVSGDTAVCDGVRRLATGVDVLVHQALLGDRVPAALLEWNADARSVGELASAVQPGHLVVTHLIPAPSSLSDEAAYKDALRAGGFDGPTTVARDLVRMELGALLAHGSSPRSAPSESALRNGRHVDAGDALN